MPESPVRAPLIPLLFAAALALLSLLFTSCYIVRPGHGGGKAASGPGRAPDPESIALPAGYRIEVAASGLTFPTAVVFDDAGGTYVLEGGYANGGGRDLPRLIKVLRKNVFVPIATGDSNGPWTGAAYAPSRDGAPGRGAFLVTEGGNLRGGRILRIGMDGGLQALAEGLPSLGDHQTNAPVLGPDGMIYFGQGTVTNSGVVGPDNFKTGWLPFHRTLHDTPCQDIILSGVNYRSADPFQSGKQKDTVETGAFSPFGAPTLPGQVVKGEVPCNGAILRIPAEGGKPELVAWGLRNPFALAFSPDGRFFALDNGYDQRGSRPIWGAGELLWEIHQGTWYGWPDFSGLKPVDRAEFTPPHGERPQRLLEKTPGPWMPTQASAGGGPPPVSYRDAPPPAPMAYLPVHASADGLDFSRSREFGFENHAFIAEFGDLAPSAGKVLEPVGFKVVRVDMGRGVAEDFAVNRKGLGPASKLGTGGLERPVSLRFSPDGKSLYVVDFGVMTVSKDGPEARQRTGVLWRIWKEGGK
ncbi:MAG TPA: glucose dehydrogenase [Fibrobacteria bacterium]|nr:glucose dehydrogenase [Fibrobacteria bacterium]